MVNVCVFSNFKFYLSRSNEPPSIQNRPVLSSNYKVEVQQGVIYRTQLISETTSTKVKQTVRGTTIKSHLSSLNGHPSIPSVFPSSNYKVEVQQSVSYKGHPSQGLQARKSSKVSLHYNQIHLVWTGVHPFNISSSQMLQGGSPAECLLQSTIWCTDHITPLYTRHANTVYHRSSSISLYQDLQGSIKVNCCVG